MEHIDLVRDILDKQLVDPSRQPLGRADGIILAFHDDGSPPELVAIESGLPPLARRIPRFLEIPTRALSRHVGVRRGKPCRIRWSRVTFIDRDVHLSLDAARSPTTTWERWLRKHFTSHIPFSG
jgi:hypothetical protein